MRRIKAGTVDVSIVIKIIDSTDGTPETGVVFNTVGIDLEYRRDGAASVDITEVTQTIAGAHADGGFVAVGNGYYRLDLPDAACASGAPGVLIHGTVTGMIVIGEYIELEVDTAADVFARIGAPAGASVSADIAALVAALAVVDGIADSILVDTGTDIPATLAAISVFIDTEVAAILTDTGTTIPALIAALNDLDAAGIRTAVGLATANLDTQLAALPTAAENRTEIDSNSTQLAAIVAALAVVDGIVDAIVVDTGTDIPALIAALNNFDPAVDTVTLTDGSLTAAKIAAAALTASKFGAGAIDAAALSTDAVQEIRDAIAAITITEQAAVPPASPTLAQAIAWQYMAVRNKRDTTASSDEIHNDAGVAIASAVVSDDGVTFIKAEYT